MQDVIPFENIPYVDPSVRSDEAAVLASQSGQQQQTGNFMFLQVGSGATAFKVDPDGMWLGADAMADAPFSADMLGNVILNSVVINGLAGSVIAGAIDADGNFVNFLISTTLDTQAKQILGEFTFVGSGALAIKTDANNGIWISPTGILAKKAGATTFALDTAGNATFAGTLTAASGTLGTITAGTITGATIQGGNIYASSSSASGNVHLYVGAYGGQCDVEYGGAQKGFFAASNTVTILGSNVRLNLEADEAMDIRANDWVQITYNDNGGTDVFQVVNDADVVFEMNDSNNAWFAGAVYAAGGISCAGHIQTGGTYKSSDGTSGVDKGPYGFVTAVESSRAKFREITTKDGLVTNIGGESGWL